MSAEAIALRSHVDVLIVGAGVSGIGGACHLKSSCPDKSFQVVEARNTFGGTWDLFRFPGIRSDSDLYTYGYGFKPWQGKPIATASEINNYLAETIAEHQLERHIHYGLRVESVDWNSAEARWNVSVLRGKNAERSTLTCSFLFMCQGYYSYELGYMPEFPGAGRFNGPTVHPQFWPENLDYRDKRVIIVGSGSTAVTMAPALAESASHVTMLQRSPGYVFSRENRSQLASLLEGLDLPEDFVHEAIRLRNLKDSETITRMAREHPEQLRQQLIDAVRDALPGFDVETHFNPRYMPWKERLCLIPDGDLFKAIRAGKVSYVTDEIETLTEKGIQLKSGDTIEGDVIVSATGLELRPFGNIALRVDGTDIDLAEQWTYRGAMYSDVPNLAWSFGYIRSSWTMRSDMVAEFVCRLLAHMDELGVHACTPRLRPQDMHMKRRTFIDSEDFNPGYMQRSMARFPAQGDHEPWINSQDYYREKHTLPGCDLDDGVLVFEGPTQERTHPAQ